MKCAEQPFEVKEDGLCSEKDRISDQSCKKFQAPLEWTNSTIVGSKTRSSLEEEEQQDMIP